MALDSPTPRPFERFLNWLSRHERGVAVALGCVLAFRLWVSPLPSSFWIDETGTVWAISGGFKDVLTHLRLDEFPQMPLFIILTWAWSQLAGTSEVALRIPSVLAMIATAILLFRMALRVADKRTAAYVILLLASLSPVSFAAADARAYSLALLAVVFGFYQRTRWLETGRLRHVILHGIAWGIVINLNYFFGAALVADSAYLVIAHRHGWYRMRPLLVVSPVITAILALPLLPTLAKLMEQKQLHVLGGNPSWTDLSVLFFPPRWIVATVAATGMLLLFIPKRLTVTHPSPVPAMVLFALWGVVPPVVLLGYSLVSGISVMWPRYLLAQAPGIVLVGAYLISRLRLPTWRLAIALVLFGMCIVGGGRRLWTKHYMDDWRGASTLINKLLVQDPSLPVLIGSPFIESERLPMPGTRVVREALLAPLTAYPVSATVSILPLERTPINYEYLDGLIASVMSQNRFVAVLQRTDPPPQISVWIEARLGSTFRMTKLYSDPLIFLFERRPQPTSP